MALQDIAPGEAIISVPYELALDLGSESSDPTAPAVRCTCTHCTLIPLQLHLLFLSAILTRGIIP